MKKYGLIVLLFIVAILLIVLFEKDDSYIKIGNLYINEIVASNSYSYKDDDKEYSDYIEIYNDNDYDVSLLNYRLTDSVFEVNKWIFPDITIKGKEYFVIFASGKNRCLEKDKCHTNFKLSSAKETVSLIDSTGNIISQVAYENLLNDYALSYVKGKYLITKPTPGKENDEEEIKGNNVNYNIQINEYLTHNKGINYSSDGGYYDWVEIYNKGEDISLLGLSLSDDPKNLNKYMLPDVVIKKGEYLIIYLNDGIEITGAISANFKLSDNDEKIILSANGKVVDEAKIVKLGDNESLGRINDEWLIFNTPTPGKENITKGRRLDNGNT